MWLLLIELYDRGSRRLFLPIPIFLLWLLLLPFLALGLCFVLITKPRYLRLLPAFTFTLFHLRGLRIGIDHHGAEAVAIRFI